MKIISSEWDPVTKTAIVVKQSQYGRHRGVATADAEDFEFATEWDGYKLASYQCQIQYFNERAKRMYERYVGIRTVYYNLCQAYDNTDPILCALKRQTLIALRDADNARKKADEFASDYNDYAKYLVDSRKFFNETLEKKKNSVDN